MAKTKSSNYCPSNLGNIKKANSEKVKQIYSRRFTCGSFMNICKHMGKKIAKEITLAKQK